MYEEQTCALDLNKGILELTAVLAPDHTSGALRFLHCMRNLDTEKATVTVEVDTEKATARLHVCLAQVNDPKPYKPWLQSAGSDEGELEPGPNTIVPEYPIIEQPVMKPGLEPEAKSPKPSPRQTRKK